MLEVRREHPRRSPRVIPARVIWVRRPQAYRSFYHVGIEFEVPGNVWDIAVPPEDWFASPEDQELVIPVSDAENITHPNQFVLRASVAEAENAGRTSETPDMLITSSRTTGTLVLPEEQPVVIAQQNAALSQADPSASIAEMVRMFTAEAVAGELARIRELINAELQRAIDRAVDRLSERITAAPALRQGVVDSSVSAGKLSEPCDQISEQSESADHQDGSEPVRQNARQRRATKRARKQQKTTP
jgi:hypothetical protein